MKLEKFLNTKYGNYIEYLSAFLSLTTALIYIISTYFEDGIPALDIIDLFVLNLLFAELLLKLLSSQHPFLHLCSTNTVIDIFTIVPLPILYLDITLPLPVV